MNDILMYATVWIIFTQLTVIHAQRISAKTGLETAASNAEMSWTGWEKSGNTYYRGFSDAANPVTYEEARANCQGFGGGLVAKVLREPVAVSELIISWHANGQPLIWIGYDDIDKEGNYVWSDGGSTNSATITWRSGEPSNSNGNEDCAVFTELSGKKIVLNDIPCDIKIYSYICEVEIPNIDECNGTTPVCSLNATCQNTEGSFLCTCNSGYTGDGLTCDDIDECNGTTPVCSLNATCQNTERSFLCTCNSGYTGDGLTCDDINECDDSEVKCDEMNGICNNTEGTYSCSCKIGYTGDGRNCTDIDECDENNGGCDIDNGICGNTAGSFSCSCKPGYTGDGQNCADNNECNNNNGGCDADNGICNNTEGSFSCTCNVGYAGDGRDCTDIDECKNHNGGCDIDNGRCNNTEGSFSCSCNSGYAGDGRNCTDIDECKNNNGGCDIDNGRCNNTEGSFSCTCKFGYTGDGQNCQSVSVPCNVSQDISDFIFPSTRPRRVAYSRESCEGSGSPKASILCKSDGVYDFNTFAISPCQSLESVLNQTFTDATLQVIQTATANTTALTSENVTAVSTFLSYVSNLDIEFSEKEVGEAVEITSHLSKFYQQSSASNLAKEKQELVNSISKISRKLESSSTGEMGFTSSSDDINVEVMDVTSGDGSYSFNASFYTDESINSTIFVPMTITLPAEAIDEAEQQISSTSVRIVSVAFRSSSLFPSTKTTGWVIASSVGNSTDSIEKIRLTNSSVIITNNEVENPGIRELDNFKTEVTELQCVFWDFQINDWSTVGCSLHDTSPRAACQCVHLTNFAILVSRSVIPKSFALAVATYIGCAISILGLLLTLCLICLTKELRSKYPAKIIANISFCLTSALSLFVFGIRSVELAVGCDIITVFMHFFFLSAWFWTSVYSYIIYRDIVRAISSYGEPFKVLYAAFAAYGIPLVIVVLNASITLGHVDRFSEESAYRAQSYCWLHKSSLYFGFLLAVGILFLFNIGVFCIVIPKVICRRSKIRSTFENPGVGKSIILIVSLFTTMGLSWIFGYLMLVSDHSSYLLTMSWIFTVVNSFQGVFIFCFTAIRTRELIRRRAQSKRQFGYDRTTSSRLDAPVADNPYNNLRPGTFRTSFL